LNYTRATLRLWILPHRPEFVHPRPCFGNQRFFLQHIVFRKQFHILDLEWSWNRNEARLLVPRHTREGEKT